MPELRFQNLRKEAAMLLKTQDRAQEVETARRAVSEETLHRSVSTSSRPLRAGVRRNGLKT